MSGQAFVDTNVLMCAHDVEAEAKHDRKSVLRDLRSQWTGVRSLPVLQAFYVNVTRKMAPPISRGDTRGESEASDIRSRAYVSRIPARMRVDSWVRDASYSLPVHGERTRARSKASRVCTGSACETITCSKERSSMRAQRG
jgi:hypothetical protein